MKNIIRITKGEIIANIILLFYTVLALLLKNTRPEMINWLGLVIFIYAIYTWCKKTKDPLFCPYSILQLFFTLFNYGQPLMWAFGIHREREIGSGVLFYGSGFYPNHDDIISAQIYTCISMIIFHFGALFFVKRQEGNHQVARNDNDSRNSNFTPIQIAMKKISMALILFVSPLAIYLRAKEALIAHIYGYNSLYYGEHATQGGYIQIILYLFFPSLVGYLIANDYSKQSRKLVYTIFGIYMVLGIVSGDRGGWLYSFIILLWLHTHYVPISLRQYGILAITGVVGIYALSAITSIRDSSITLDQIDWSSSLNAENTPITNAFFEMGGSMSLIVFFLSKGNAIYPYTNTYLTSILGVASSRVLSIFGIKQVLIADWFSQDYLGISWGTGFSMIAEAFVNGGYWGGFIYIFILGIIHGKLLEHANSIKGGSPLRIFVTVSSLNVIVGFARGAMYLVLKELFYGVFLVSILIIIVAKRIQPTTVSK